MRSQTSKIGHKEAQKHKAKKHRTKGINQPLTLNHYVNFVPFVA